MTSVGTSPDWYQAVANGLIMGAVIMGLYLLQKWMEHRRIKYDMAIMMSDEITSMLIVGSASKPNMIMPRGHKVATRDTYLGLLSSGRIVRFDRDLRRVLALIYHQFDYKALEVDRGMCVTAIEKLEKIEARNRLFKLPG